MRVERRAARRRIFLVLQKAFELLIFLLPTLVSDTVRDAFTREKGKVANGLVLHSDQGCQYTSEEYFALTQEYHFAASMSRRGCPYDNALMENFFALIHHI